ncbi:sensor kinase [Escherichia coli]|nr:sensor kinase [Escherichia coli]STF57551.1 sensor kinase [Escherichia coli]
MKLTDADNAADGIFFPALEQNMMGAVLINENDEVMFFNPAAEKLWDTNVKKSLAITLIC